MRVISWVSYITCVFRGICVYDKDIRLCKDLDQNIKHAVAPL